MRSWLTEAVVTIRMAAALGERLDELRFEPIAKRIRAGVDGDTVLDTTRAILVWEPRRVVPSYAIPEDDISAVRTARTDRVGDVQAGPAGVSVDSFGHRPVLDPRVPFAVHTAPGEQIDLQAGGRTLEGYRVHDDALAGYLVIDFDGADEWFEEDERNLAHPRDPFHRIEVLPSSRHVRLELDGVVLAESSRPQLLFESMLPMRYYLPVEDVQVELRASDEVTWCAYKGRASYLSAVVGDRLVDDLVWTYPAPLYDAERVRDMLCFFDERVDVHLDGTLLRRPLTPWS
jgi:uncharacterized protein (DUF427 family)